MQRTVDILLALCQTHLASPIIIMESTAHYHRILHQYFINVGIEVVVINPIQSGGLKNLNIRKIKNDKTDAKRLALLYHLQMLQKSSEQHGILDALKDLTRQRTDIVSERVKFSNKLTALLDQAFPGYRKVFRDLRGKASLAVLCNFPTPKMVLSTHRDVILAVAGTACGRRVDSLFLTKKIDELILTAKSAEEICISRVSFEHLIILNASMLKTLEQAANELEEVIISLAKNNASVWEKVELLVSIPGIANYSATVLLAEIGDRSRFSKPKQLVAFCGLDPSVKQSGKSFSAHNRISKRGSSYLRNTLNICTHVAVHSGRAKTPQNPVLASFYEEKHKSKPANVAFCACMRKMVLIIYAVLRNGTPFELRTPEEHVDLMKEYNAALVA